MRKITFDQTPAYLSWLHTLTVLGYEKNIHISRADEQLLELLYKEKKSPKDSLEEISQVFRRIDAINANPE